jgi:hypothetical protein
MGASKMINEFKRELLAAESVLDTEYSFDLAEPNYLRCLEIVRAHPEMRAQFSASLIGLYEANEVSDEPVAYLMHVLRWPEVASWVEERLRNLPDPVATGASLEKILAAYGERWENKEFYAHL